MPNFLYQAKHTAAPWDSSPRFGAPVQLSRNLLGGDRVSIALLLAAMIGVAELFTRAHRRTRDATVMWTLIALPVRDAAAGVDRLADHPRLGAALLRAGARRDHAAGRVRLLARRRRRDRGDRRSSVIFLINPSSYTPAYKSDMRDISGEMTPRLHSGDLVISAQPEQIPLTWYYLPNGLRYANTIGPVADPSYMDWVARAQPPAEAANPRATLAPLLASLKPGQQILYVRPLTEGRGQLEGAVDPAGAPTRRAVGSAACRRRDLREVAVAPHNYRGACCVADSAVLYQKVS